MARLYLDCIKVNCIISEKLHHWYIWPAIMLTICKNYIKPRQCVRCVLCCWPISER